MNFALNIRETLFLIRLNILFITFLAASFRNKLKMTNITAAREFAKFLKRFHKYHISSNLVLVCVYICKSKIFCFFLNRFRVKKIK